MYIVPHSTPAASAAATPRRGWPGGACADDATANSVAPPNISAAPPSTPSQRDQPACRSSLKNSNSLIGIVWGLVFFNELRQAGWSRWLGVLGGAALMFGGATLLAVASSAHAPPGHPLRGVAAALAAGVLWGTMYIPYRKAYLTGMNPLSFVTFFTVGELGMMFALAVTDRGGVAALAADLHRARDVLFWLLLGGFVWVVGDLFQQYAAKYVGISRGIPLSNTNQLWGLLWGTLVFAELRGGSRAAYAQVIGGSLLMAAGAAAIAGL